MQCMHTLVTYFETIKPTNLQNKLIKSVFLACAQEADLGGYYPNEEQVVEIIARYKHISAEEAWRMRDLGDIIPKVRECQ